MTVLKNVELTDTLRAIMSRNTEFYQTDYAGAMQDLMHDERRHYLFLTYREGTFLAPEEMVYYRESFYHKAWLSADESQLEYIKAYAVSVDRRMPGHVRGNIYPLDFGSHVTDVLMNTTSATDIHSRVGEHVRLLHEARNSRKPISVGGYLRKLSDEYMTRGGPYRAGFRRICLPDAFALLKEDILPVYQLNAGQYDRPLDRGALRMATHQDSFGIRITDSSDYDRWQREMLVEHYEQLQRPNRTKGSEARG